MRRIGTVSRNRATDKKGRRGSILIPVRINIKVSIGPTGWGIYERSIGPFPPNYKYTMVLDPFVSITISN